MNTIQVRTTQNVAVEYEVASLGDRILAQLIDYTIFFGWAMLMFGLLQLSEQLDQNVWLNLVVLLPILFYDLLCEVFLNGQSIGKKARDIKVIKLSGEAPTVVDFLIRWIFRIIDTGTLGMVAIVTIASDSKGQRLGDIAAGTSVIRNRPVRKQSYFQIRTEENYSITYPEVGLLTDQDVALMRKLLYKAFQHRNHELLQRLSERTQEVMGIKADLSDEDFMKTVIKDQHHYALQVEA